MLGGVQGSAGSAASNILPPAHPPVPQASELHPPAPMATPLPPPALPRGVAAELNGPAVQSSMCMWYSTLREEASRRNVYIVLRMALGSAPHSREVWGTAAFGVAASVGFPQDPAYALRTHNMRPSLCPAYAPAYAQRRAAERWPAEARPVSLPSDA